MIALEVRSLDKRFGNNAVLRDVELAIPSGSIYALMGRNGAGKTTLFRLCMALYRPDRGEVSILGRNVHDDAAAMRVVGYVGQPDFFPEWEKIATVLAFERAIRAGWDESGLERWMKGEKIPSDRRIRALSSGQRKRLELEMVLAWRPRVLLLDEPFSGLDPVARTEAMATLSAFAAEGTCTIVISSHALGDLERLCDSIAVLAAGRIVVEAEIDALKEGGAIVSRRGTGDGMLPVAARELASLRTTAGHTWILGGLTPEDRTQLVAEGFSVVDGNLEAMGTELLRRADAKEEDDGRV